MKASFFVSLPYGPVGEHLGRWPVPNRLFDADRAVDVVASRMDHVELADELGFDWIGCAEHHYSPGSLASNVSAVAAAITQRSRRARVCIMGALLPLNNPVRVAEEYALVDAMSGGRLWPDYCAARRTSTWSTACRQSNRARASKKHGSLCRPF